MFPAQKENVDSDKFEDGEVETVVTGNYVKK
jgi:hypothetical protein